MAQPDLSCSRPVGDPTTVLDICDRNDQDDYLFPLTTNSTWFTRDSSRRTIPFSISLQETNVRGEAKFGGTFQVELGTQKNCDLLMACAIQVKLSHWLPNWIQALLRTGQFEYENPNDAWFWANSIGTSFIQDAELLLEDQTLERVSGDFARVFSFLFPDLNTSVGIGVDAYGFASMDELKNWNPAQSMPTEKGWISCILPFSFTRQRLRNTFPLIAVKEGTVRRQLKVRPFHELVRKGSWTRESCKETPLGKTLRFIDKRGASPIVYSYKVPTTVPEPESIRCLTYGVVVDGLFRSALLRKPFDRLYRDVQQFVFDEPKKYTSIVSTGTHVNVQFPLECNGPIEEILWFVRRKAVSVANEWTNFNAVLQKDYDPVFQPMAPLLVSAAIQIDGITVVDEPEVYYRHHIGKAHKGGIVPYRAFVYGYSFARSPGEHNPSGWFNASRTSDVRMRLSVQPPGGGADTEWEIVVFTIGMNWVRFENGIANRVYNS